MFLIVDITIIFKSFIILNLTCAIVFFVKNTIFTINNCTGYRCVNQQCRVRSDFYQVLHSLLAVS